MRREILGHNPTHHAPLPKTYGPVRATWVHLKRIGKRFAPFAGPVLAILLVLGVCLFHYVRHFDLGRLTPDSLDTIQSARYLAKTGKFGTLIIRPLLTGQLPLFPDGAMPDLAHQPVYLILCAVVMKVSRHTSMGLGDRDAALISTLLFAGSIIVCYCLTRRFFPDRQGGSRWGAALAAVFYALGTSGLSVALQCQPLTLAAFLFPLLLLCLHTLETRLLPGNENLRFPFLVPGANGIGPPATTLPAEKPIPLLWLVLSAVLYALLFLSVYSTLILLPVLLFYIWVICRRKLQYPLLFLLVAILVTAPYQYHNWKTMGFPLFHSRLYDLISNTSTYSGYGLYRSSDLLAPIPQYLATGGVQEILQKVWNNLGGYYNRVPLVFGVFLFPLFLAASLTRFADGAVNRMRNLVYGCMVVHLIGLAFFQTPDEAVQILLMYVPFAAALGATFLLSFLRARNLPAFFARATVGVWATLAALPGLLVLGTEPSTPPRISDIYYHINTNAPEMQVLRPERIGVLAADAPWEVAFRCDYPAVWLPNDKGTMDAVESRGGKPIGGVILSPTTRVLYGNDADARPWVEVYERLVSITLTVTPLDRVLRETIANRVRLYYPPRITEAMQNFDPQPRPEDDNSGVALMFWNRELTKPQPTTSN